MLADDERVDGSRIDAQMLAEIEAQTRGIQYRARTEHMTVGQARKLFGGIGQHINGIRDDQQDTLEIALGDLGDDRLEDADVLLNQVKAGLTGLLRRTGGDDDDRAVGDIVIIARIYLARL